MKTKPRDLWQLTNFLAPHEIPSMTALFPALEATLINPRINTPSLERPRLTVDGEILPALYHYEVYVEERGYDLRVAVSAQHEIEAAERALERGTFREEAVRAGSVIVAGVNERGGLSEYRVSIRVAEDGTVAIPP